jgi:intracellular sulfur oxidation DsrE/DsrF family protein
VEWVLSQSSSVSVNQTKISVFHRRRGGVEGVKMTGMVGESPCAFVKGVVDFTTRKHWEGMFEDGIVVQPIDTGEPLNALILTPPTTPLEGGDGGGKGEKGEGGKSSVTPKGKLSMASRLFTSPFSGGGAKKKVEMPLPESFHEQAKSLCPAVARNTDDVLSFLQTVDIAGVPRGMAIAFLNDPERQHALTHLRKQMMLSRPMECMLCQRTFEKSLSDIRFCPVSYSPFFLLVFALAGLFIVLYSAAQW